jgi:hypothetical protein
MHRRQWTRFWTHSNARIPASMWRRRSACTRPGDGYAETNPPAYVTVSLGSGRAVLVPHHRSGFSTYARSPLRSTPTRSQCRSRQSRPTCGIDAPRPAACAPGARLIAAKLWARRSSRTTTRSSPRRSRIARTGDSFRPRRLDARGVRLGAHAPRHRPSALVPHSPPPGLNACHWPPTPPLTPCHTINNVAGTL